MKNSFDCVRHIGSFASDRRGNVTIIGAFLIGALIAFVSLVSEYGMGLERQNKDQRIADLASFAAANYYMANSTDGNVMASATSVAQNVAALNGVPGSDVQVNLVTSPTNASANAIKVKVTTAAPLFLAKLVGGGTSLTDSASSYAQVVSGPGNGCVLSLNNSAVDDLWANGNTTLNLKNCDIYDNSSSSAALSVGGSASVTVRSAYIVGGVYGSSKINASGTVQTGASRTQDPYRSVDIPAYTGCDHTSYSTTTNATLNPGVYCNGFQITSHAVVTLNPGLYIFDRGAFSISGQATLQGATVNGVSGVTLVFTSSTGSSWPTVTINGGATVNLTAPTTADIKAGNNGLNGILFYGDRNMPVGTAFKINGGSSQTLTGAIYLPEAAINYSGTTDVNNACLQLIGDTITFIGTSNVAISGCGQFALRTFGAPLDNSQNKVGLVE